MKGIREIRQRIKSVKGTAQITRAMQLVAASKMKRAQAAALLGRPYALLMAEILVSLLEKAGDMQHPFLQGRPVVTRGVLVVATDKGLCGGLNTNLFRHVVDVQGPARYVTIGRKATQFLSRTGHEVMAEFSVTDHAAFAEVRSPAEYLIRAYLEGKVDTVEVLYTRFINTLRQEPCLQPILPLTSLAETLETLRHRLGKDGAALHADTREMAFEPNANALLAALPELFVKQEVYQMVLESKASEHSARMVAMKSATDNAKNLVDSLTLEYNKARQAGITQEILEIAASTLQSA